MRHAPFLAALALLAVACRESATDPVQPPRGVFDAAPSGIPVAATRAGWDYHADLRNASATLAGDSLVFTYVSGTGCGRHFDAVAGMADGTLLVTDVGRAPEGVAGCLAIAYPGGVPVRLAVRAAARGRTAVVLRERTESVPAGGGFVERDILRRTVTFP